MRKYDWNFIVGTSYISVIVGVAIAMVGTVPESRTEPVHWWFPVQIFISLAALFWLGYDAGKNSKE